MNISQENTGPLTAQITINLKPEDYKKEVNDKLKAEARKANLPGFRPGKVPVGVIRKMVGKSVLLDAINHKVSHELGHFLDETEINLLGQPIPVTELNDDDLDPNCENEYNISFDVGLAPELDVNLELPDMPFRYEISIDDESLQEDIDNYADRFADVSNPEDVAEGDIVYGRVFEVNAEGEAVEEGFDRMMAFNPTRIERDEFFAPLVGKKLEEILPVDILSLRENSEELVDLLFVEQEILDTLTDKTLHLEIKRVNRVEKAEMNEEFFTKVAENLGLEKTEFASEDSFRDELRMHQEDQLKESAAWEYRNRLQEYLIESHDTELPTEFLKRWILDADEKYKSEEDVEQDWDDLKKSFIWQLIVDKLQKDNEEELKVSGEELEENIRESLKQNLRNMGQAEDDERLDEYIKYTMQNREMLDMYYRRAFNDKLYGFLDSKITPESKSISAKEFNEMQEKKKAEQAQ